MHEVDRKTGPGIQAIKTIDIPNVLVLDEEKHIPLYFVAGGTEKIARIECVIPAGRKYEKKRATASLTTSLLQEGTSSKTSSEIAELLDFYGFRFKARNDFDFAYISISCLTKHFHAAIDLFFDIIKNPIFPEHELNVAKNTAHNNLKIHLERNEFVAYRLLTESIFGENHVYGYNTEPEDFQNVTRDDIQAFYKNNYALQNAFVIASGQLEASQLDALQTYLPGKLVGKNKIGKANAYGENAIVHRIEQKIEDSLQTAIKIGKKTFVKNHPDFLGMYVLSTVLGGYFGSRLMQSIREKHGYSYNIYSSLEIMEEHGYLCISTEVGSQYTEQSLNVIFEEIERLRNELIPEKELLMVKNYLLGKILRDLDGPFNSASYLKNQLITGGNMTDLPSVVEGIRSIKSIELQDLSERYFSKKSFTTVIVS